MDIVRKIWPTPFKMIKKGDFKAFVIQVVAFILIVVVLGWLFGLLGRIPVLGLVFRLVDWVIRVYALVAIVLSVLNVTGVFE